MSRGGGHARHYKEEEQKGYRLLRSGKHRYVYFCSFDKHLKKQWMNDLNYPVMPYPKGDNNPDYELGNYLKPVLVKDERIK